MFQQLKAGFQGQTRKNKEKHLNQECQQKEIVNKRKIFFKIRKITRKCISKQILRINNRRDPIEASELKADGKLH